MCPATSPETPRAVLPFAERLRCLHGSALEWRPDEHSSRCSPASLLTPLHSKTHARSERSYQTAGTIQKELPRNHLRVRQRKHTAWLLHCMTAYYIVSDFEIPARSSDASATPHFVTFSEPSRILRENRLEPVHSLVDTSRLMNSRTLKEATRCQRSQLTTTGGH